MNACTHTLCVYFAHMLHTGGEHFEGGEGMDISDILNSAFGGGFQGFGSGGGGFDMGGMGGGARGGSRQGGRAGRAKAQGLYTDDPYVIELTPSNFPGQGDRWVHVVEFYAPWWVHCLNFAGHVCCRVMVGRLIVHNVHGRDKWCPVERRQGAHLQ